MLDMFRQSVRLFFTGKLFRDYHAVFRQWAIGFALACALLLAIGWLVSPVAGVVVASVAGGMLQPYLFKDLKYA